MNRLASCFLAVAVALASAACGGYARGIAIGAGAPARAADCKLTYSHVSPHEAQARWRQVGDVCVSTGVAPASWAYAPGDIRDALTERACALGGEVVTPVGLCANERVSGVEFGVYVAKTGQGAAVPPLAADEVSAR